jgi:hypothetical protein
MTQYAANSGALPLPKGERVGVRGSQMFVGWKPLTLTLSLWERGFGDECSAQKRRQLANCNWASIATARDSEKSRGDWDRPLTESQIMSPWKYRIMMRRSG